MNDMNSIAIFIDGDNISHRDIPLMIEEIKTHGKIIYNSLFCDMSDTSMNTCQDTCIQNGISLVHCERISGKNSTDIKLIVELMNILYTNELITLFYIITSDSDYRHVIPRIREKGKLIYCIGNQNTNQSLQKICQKFTYIETLRKISDDTEDNTEDDTEDNTVRPLTKKCKKKYKKVIMNLFDTKDVINIGNIMISLQNKYNFDYREYGYDQMKYFLQDNYPELHSKDGNVSLEPIT